MKNVYKFTESSALTPGNQVTTFEMDGIKCGLAICYDMYFEEFAKLYRKAGVELMFYPAAFNTVIGPLQWEILNRARANDNQFYVITISPARNPASLYEAWGFSMAVNPWAQIITQAKEHEETLHTVIGKDEGSIRLTLNRNVSQVKFNQWILSFTDFDTIKKYRTEIPTFDQRRTDIYDIVRKWG